MGSNSFHLLVARVLRDGRIEKLGSRKATLRLGDALAANPDGIIPPEPFAKALETVGEMAAAVDHYRVERFAAVGTSALRDAKNGPELVAMARARHGVNVEILSGDEEGRLAYQGARVAALDASMAVSHAQALDLARRFPGTPAFLVSHHVNRLIKPSAPPADRLRAGYFGELANTVRPDSLAGLVELVGINTSRVESSWIERLPETLAGLHYLAFACLMLTSLLGTPLWSS